MDLCKRCGVEKLQAVTVDDSMDVAGHTFSAHLPGRRCPACGDVLVEARDVREFERAVILALVRSGQRSGAVVRALRKWARLSVTRLAELLDVTAALVTDWEEGDAPVPPAAAAVLRSLVASQCGGAELQLDTLAVLREPRQLAQKIRLHLERSFERALGGPAAPALA
jgi:putative zinc finger/helix-turn-helix YgiT family protein